MQCPCCSNKSYEECCKPYIEDDKPAPTPETLMRSRYTAYSQAKIDYIEKTMKGPALKNFLKENALQWAKAVEFKNLTVVKSYFDTHHHDIGFVEFIITTQFQGKLHQLHELSEFHQEKGIWFYVNGNTPKIGRNGPCPCGSGKKYKKCCMTKS